MKTKLFALSLGLAVLAVGCGGGDKTNVKAPDEPGSTARAAQASPGTTPAVKRAPAGEINPPSDGAYVYAYETKTTNSATPDATPRTSARDAELTSTVTTSGKVTTTKDKSTEGSAVATLVQRWESSKVLDLSSKIETDQGSAGCEYSPAPESLHIPIKAETFKTQAFAGKGSSCGGERKITVEKQEKVKDARGVEWSTWRIQIETVSKQTGLTKTNTDTRWFSPDLGKDIRIEGLAEYVNSEGKVAVRAQQTSILESYPKA
jgi:hypothetical protein